MNEFDAIADHFGDQANVANAAAAGAVPFKQDQIAGLGILPVDRVANLALSRTRVG